MNTNFVWTKSLGGFLVKAQPKMFNYAVYQPILFRINQLSWCVAKIKLDPLRHSCFCSITLCSAIHCVVAMWLVGRPKILGVSVTFLQIIPSFYYSVSGFRTNWKLTFINGKFHQDFTKKFLLPITWQWTGTADIILSKEKIHISYEKLKINVFYLEYNWIPIKLCP
jgi:hypothetical protein